MTANAPTQNAAHQAAWRARRKAELEALRKQTELSLDRAAKEINAALETMELSKTVTIQHNGHVALILLIDCLLDYFSDNETDEVIELARETVRNAKKAELIFWETE